MELVILRYDMGKVRNNCLDKVVQFRVDTHQNHLKIKALEATFHLSPANRDKEGLTGMVVAGLSVTGFLIRRGGRKQKKKTQFSVAL